MGIGDCHWGVGIVIACEEPAFYPNSNEHLICHGDISRNSHMVMRIETMIRLNLSNLFLMFIGRQRRESGNENVSIDLRCVL